MFAYVKSFKDVFFVYSLFAIRIKVVRFRCIEESLVSYILAVAPERIWK